jgi:hypothetical protein
LLPRTAAGQDDKKKNKYRSFDSSVAARTSSLGMTGTKLTVVNA